MAKKKLLSALLVTAGCVGAACGGKVVVDMEATSQSTSGSTGGGATAASSTQGAGAAGGGGCDPASHTIDFAEYDPSCMVPEDCMGAFLGDFCQLCSCPFAAINVADKAKYEAEAAMKAAGTPPDTCSCPAHTTTCEQGQCVTHVP